MISKLLRGAFAAAALLFAPLAQAQDAPATTDADPALWLFQDADTKIYLFGTIHVLKPGLSWFDEAVKQAFDASDELVMELADPTGLEVIAAVQKLAGNPAGPPLTQQLPEDKRAAYAAAMTSVGLPPAVFDGLDPWAAAITLSVLPVRKFGYDPTSGVEMVLLPAARAAGKTVEGLESAEEQLGYLDRLPPEKQIAYLIDVVDSIDELGPLLDRMVTTWSAGQPDALGEILNEGMRDTPEVAKALLADRNAAWADKLAARLDKPGTVFVAVGAGHLAGPDSVQAMLAKRGITATRIAY